MPDYEKMYYKLFNSITDIIEQLKQVQIEAEEEFINSNNNDYNEKTNHLQLIKLKRK